MSNTLPQRGHLGRLRFCLAKVGTRGEVAWHADWTIIVDPPQRTLTRHFLSRMLRAVYGVTATAR